MPLQPAALELLAALKPVLDRWGRWSVFGATTVPIIDVGDLLVAKVLAGRPKDLEDVRALWSLHAHDIDVARVRRTLRLLEEALAQGDLVSTFDRIAQPHG